MEAVIECPHCLEPTAPNPLPDGSRVCSCAAERPLPPPAPAAVSDGGVATIGPPRR